MKVRRIYRSWDSDMCHINVKRFINRRIMPIFNPHLHNELEIIYIVHGTYEIYRPEGNHLVGAQTVYIVPPNEIHSIRSLQDDGEYITLIIDPCAISMNQKHFFQKGFVQPLQTGKLQLPRMFGSSDPGYKELTQYLEQLRQLQIRDPSCLSKRFVFTIGFCTELMNYCRVAHADAYLMHAEAPVAQKCADYINEHFSEKICLDTLARHVHVHPNYLCSAFKKDAGMTVLEYLNRVRVEWARTYLKEGELNVAQVAERCGFQSISAFQRTFKAYTGTTPSKFAKVFKL